VRSFFEKIRAAEQAPVGAGEEVDDCHLEILKGPCQPDLAKDSL
jgi:hypothetical protein